MLAVLRDAVLTFLRTAGATDVRRRRLFVETAAWFASPSTEAPFAFATICDTLGLDAAYIRSGLARDGIRQRRATRRPSGAGVVPPVRAAG